MQYRFTCTARAAFLTVCLGLAPVQAEEVVKYCRFQMGDTIAYGVVEGDSVRRLDGDLFGKWSKTDQTYPLKKVKLLVPTQPQKVFAMAGNYKSHLSEANLVNTTITTVTKVTSDQKTGAVKSESTTKTETLRSDEVPKKLQIPQPFFKSPSCLVAEGATIVIPKGATTVHYEAEMVIVIGKRCKNVSPAEAGEYVFGVTCGNDISARVWQKNDVQWWRAKASDTFGPCGPFIATGLNYDDITLQLRLNGKVRQKEQTSYLIHNVAKTVSFISEHSILEPGDLIFTGTPGQTDEIKPGDVLEVELEGVGVLRNSVAAE